MVDPQGRIPPGRGCPGGGAARVRGGDGQSGAGRPREALGELKQLSGKVISVWCVGATSTPRRLRSNTFALEWPPRSGRIQAFPEIDRAAWFNLEAARSKLVRGPGPVPGSAARAKRLASPGVVALSRCWLGVVGRSAPRRAGVFAARSLAGISSNIDKLRVGHVRGDAAKGAVTRMRRYFRERAGTRRRVRPRPRPRPPW